jgi:predicted ATPase
VQPDEVDALRFQSLVGAASRARADGQWKLAASQLQTALALWRGAALPEFASKPFAVAEVARLEELRLRAVEDRIDAELNLGGDAELVPELRGLVAEFPLRERLCAELMVALYRSGLQSQASEVYHRTRARLIDELGMEPGPLLERLFRDILRQAGYLESRGVGPVLHNLPPALTSFVGRANELAQLTERLAAVRLLTLTGTGGIGKTRLALELARQVIWRFPDGIWLIDLSPTSDPEMIPQAVAAQLKVPEQPGRTLTDTLAAHLHDRRALLVLDNCERVLDGGAEFALAMLSRCNGLKLLATSRERLGIVGEQVWRVGPLSVPETSAGLEQLLDVESMRLLLERAILVSPDFRLSESNAKALVQICRRLDGIPLALELAAAQMASFTPDELAWRLDDRLDLLTTHERGRPARHQTLRAALEWSHHLLDPSEKVLFRRLGVFNGGFDNAAIAAVCSGPRQRRAITQIAAHLVDKSMVLNEAPDRNRFRMLETIREYARDRAHVAGETRALGRRHAEYFLGMVDEHGPRLRSMGATQHLAELDRNLDNIRAALEWASANDHRLLRRLAVGMHSYWSSRCAFREALIWVTFALSNSDADAHLRQPLLASAGWLELVSGQLDRAFEHSQEALHAAEATRDARGKVRALMNLSEALASRGDYASGYECLTRARGIAEVLQAQRSTSGSFNDQALLAGLLAMIGDYLITWDKPEQARDVLVSAIQLASHAGDCFAEALARCWQSEVELAEGNLSTAAELARRGLELGMAIDNRFVMLRAMGQLATVAGAQGMVARALRLAAAVDSFRGTSGAQGFDQVDFWFGQGWSSRLQRLRELAGPAHASRIWDEGARLNVYDAAAVALAAPVSPAAKFLTIENGALAQSFDRAGLFGMGRERNE